MLKSTYYTATYSKISHIAKLFLGIIVDSHVLYIYLSLSRTNDIFYHHNIIRNVAFLQKLISSLACERILDQAITLMSADLTSQFHATPLAKALKKKPS